ncbi:hypothetical protein [Qipengyuania sp. MTN3-11]|uniref:hypothetical protein n=1 Tax=Qipengyuania sp. MTN3-11 TaxID=3056557 RepID=UPI0036F1A5D5
MRFTTTVSLLALCAASPLLGQEADEPTADEVLEEEILQEGEVIVVRADRLRGQLDVEQPPIVEYDAEDIKAFGAGSIADVIAQLEPATGSARGRNGGGRPIFLINGVRIGSFREFRSYPPEAIEKVEVFPEEVAQRFGYSPDRRVVNFILKNNYSSKEIEVGYEQPDRGGFSRNEQEFTLLQITDGARINVNLEANDASLLTESERDLVLVAGQQSDVSTDPDPLRFRSLVADSASYQAEANYAKAFIDSGSSISLNLTGNREESLSLSGIDGVTLTAPDGSSAFRTFNAEDPLTRDRVSNSIASSGSFDKPIGDFQFTATYDAGWTDTRTLTERRVDAQSLVDAAAAGILAIDGPLPALADAGRDRADSTLWNASTLATLRGQPILLPGGEVSTTIDLGYDWNRIESEDTRSAISSRLTRGDLSGGLSVVVPVTSRREGFLDGIGTISLNGQAGFNRLSDFGTLYDWTLGVTWEPFDNLSLSASRIFREVAPSLSALGDPVISEFNVPVFDYATGQSVLADVVTGGNPNLVAETQADWKFSANWELPFWERARLQVDYAVNSSDDVTLSSPAFTSAFEAAFPDRVVRDASNRLLAVDRRPVTLFETRSKTLSFGFNVGGQIGSPPPEREERGGGGPRSGGAPAGAAPAGGRPGGPGGGMFAMSPERMAEIRERFCATPEGEAPDLSGLPEQMIARLRNPDGTIPPERLQTLRDRFCRADAAERAEEFARMRTLICAEPPNLDALPPEVLARLRNEAGEIDPERLAQLRQRMCAARGQQSDESEGERRGGGRGGRGGGPGAFLGGGGENTDTRPRYFLSVNHTIALENEILLAENGPLFDQLDGFTIAGGALPRHTSRIEGGIFFQGYGVRASANYIGEAVVRGNGLPGSSDLFYGDLATVDLRLFANLGEVIESEAEWLQDLRLSLRADNIFDARRRVEDESGIVPLAFQPFRIDPTGRYLGIELRKLF